MGHFSGKFPGAVRMMIAQLAQVLRSEGFEWVAFTGTSCLRNAFGRLGLAPVEIACASADRLSREDQFAWGSYYQQSPRVFIGRISEGWQVLGRPSFGSTSLPVGAEMHPPVCATSKTRSARYAGTP